MEAKFSINFRTQSAWIKKVVSLLKIEQDQKIFIQEYFKVENQVRQTDRHIVRQIVGQAKRQTDRLSDEWLD